MSGTFAESVQAIATKVFLKTEPSVPWANVQALLQIMQTKSLTSKRESNVEQMTKSMNSVGVSEAWKWPVDMVPLTNGGSYARGGAFTFANEDTMVHGQATAALYQHPIEIPISDLDVFASASDNENAVGIVVNKFRNAKIRLGQIITSHLTATAPGANDIASLLALVDSTGTACAINQGVAGNANWASNETDLAGARLTIRTLGRKIRDMRRTKMAKIDCVIVGSAVHQFLQDEADAINQPVVDIVDFFGKSPKTGESNLYLETSHSVMMVEGSPIIIDESLDTNSNSTVLGLTLSDVCLYAAKAANFSIEGFEKVNLSAGKDAQRAQIKWDGFFALFNRATHFKFINAKVA